MFATTLSSSRCPPASATGPPRISRPGSSSVVTAVAPKAIPSASSARNASPCTVSASAAVTIAAGSAAADAVFAGQHPHALAADELLEAAGGAPVHPGVVDAGDRQVADLAGAAMRAGADGAVQHDAEPDAAVEPQQGVVGAVPGRAEQPLGDRRQVDVIALTDRDAEGVGHQRGQAGGLPALDVPSVPQVPGDRVDDARRRDDHPVHRGAGEPGRREDAVDGGRHLVDRGGLAPLPDLDLMPGDDLTGQRGQPGHAEVLLDVHPDHVAGPRVHRIDPRVRTGPALDHPGGGDQSPFVQPAQQRGHRRLGQPGLFADPAARHRTLREEQPEHHLVVDLPEQAGRVGAALRGPH